jgi:quercetin dioxygenase-like cupin family protein
MSESYPYTIDNGHGEQLIFTGVIHGPDGDRAEAEGVAQPGAGPPMHVHYLQEEAARVVTGRLAYQVLGEEPKVADVGELVVCQPARRTSGGTPARPNCA